MSLCPTCCSTTISRGGMFPRSAARGSRRVSKEELLNGAVLLIIRACQRLGVSSGPKSGLYRVCIYLRVGDSLVSEESPISYVLRSSAHPPFSRLARCRCPGWRAALAGFVQASSCYVWIDHVQPIAANRPLCLSRLSRLSVSTERAIYQTT